MTTNKWDLPKVRVKFKTNTSDIGSDGIDIPRLSKYDAAPSIFPERVKMGKEIHEAFMRYRKLKKNNYIRQIANQRKNVSQTQCKKVEGFDTKSKNATFHDKLQIALECSFARGFRDNNSEQFRRNKFSSIKSKNKQSKQTFCTGNDPFIIKPKTVSLKSKKTNGYSLNISDLSIDQPQSSLGLEGVRCQYQTQDERKNRMLRLLGKTKKTLKVTQGSNSFLIQAWKQDTIYRGASYYLRNHSDSYQF